MQKCVIIIKPFSRAIQCYFAAEISIKIKNTMLMLSKKQTKVQNQNDMLERINQSIDQGKDT